MIYSLLPEPYKKVVRTEKILRAVLSSSIVLAVILVMVVVLLLPSYFFLVFSRDDVLRRLDAEQTTFARRDVKSLEREIDATNEMTRAYLGGRAKHQDFSPILMALSNAGMTEIHLSQITIRQGSGKYVVELAGNADTRDDFLQYVRRLKSEKAFDTVTSPVSNLLKDKNAPFNIVVGVKKEVFYYAQQ